MVIEKFSFQRLPTEVVPENYDIFIRLNLQSFIFEGREIIQIKVISFTNKIVLNSADLKIGNASLLLKSTNTTLNPTISLSNEDETLTLNFVPSIPVGDAELHLHFGGELNDKLKGFYRSKCTGSSHSEKRYCAVTQFAPTDARRCFPCWDEPATKARFDITLAVDNNVKVALSNMPVKDEQIIGQERILKFERTPVMSTYLVGLVVGDFDFVEDTSADGVLVRVYTPVGKQDQGTFALHVATKVVPYYKDYFQIAYPLPKIDLIAIADLSYSAMENWGLVTYREASLLVDEANTSAINKQAVALVVGHELAHQWFGNLVTMEWWTHLWLNEGYASFIEFLCVDYLFPEYDIWTQFVANRYCRALELDALNNSHPIEVAVSHPNEISEIFDSISYNKGASLIRMLHRFIGDNNFRKGMNLYLTRHQYGNTSTEDLWDALEEASSKPVKRIMSNWTKQKGFPIISVEDSIQEADNKRTFTISQSKFSVGADKSKDSPLWLIPVSFSSSKAPNKQCYSIMLDTVSAKITVPNIQADEWVKLNVNTVGFYRTNYPSHLLDQFIGPIKDRVLPPLDRLGLLDDLFALISTGLSKTTDVLKLMQAMTEEDNYTVWTIISSCLEKIHILLYNTDFDELFVKYASRIIKPISEKLGFEPKPEEGHLDILLRNLILNKLFWLNGRDYIEYAKNKFVDHCNGTSLISADLRGPIYKAALATGGKEAYNAILKLIEETDLQEEKDRLTTSFIAITDEDIIKDALQYSISGGLGAHNTVIIIKSIALSKFGRNLAWNFISENWDYLRDKLQGGVLLSGVVKYTTESFASEVKAQMMELFFADKKVEGIERIVQQSLETVRNNAAWLERDKDSIYKFLRAL